MCGESRVDDGGQRSAAEALRPRPFAQDAAASPDPPAAAWSVGPMIVILDQQDHILGWTTEAGERLRFKDHPEAALKEVYEWSWPRPDDQQAARAQLRARGTWSKEGMLVTSGNGRWVEVSLGSLFGADGEATGTLMVVRDVVQRKSVACDHVNGADITAPASHGVADRKNLISICVECKSMRDGMSEWQPVDMYLRQRLNTAFAYMMCPECVRRLYPALDQDEPASWE